MAAVQGRAADSARCLPGSAPACARGVVAVTVRPPSLHPARRGGRAEAVASSPFFEDGRETSRRLPSTRHAPAAGARVIRVCRLFNSQSSPRTH